jgi:hypothetical protein
MAFMIRFCRNRCGGSFSGSSIAGRAGESTVTQDVDFLVARRDWNRLNTNARFFV